MHTRGYLGIDAGTQGLSVIFTDEAMNILAHGEGGYAMFVGRFGEDKGAHRAVEAARRAGVPLRIAAKMRERDEEEYFFHALGRDGDGNKDLGDEGVSGQLADCVVASLRKNRSLMATLGNLLRSRDKAATWNAVLQTVEDAVHQEGWEFALDYIAKQFLDVPWWNDLAPCWHEKL